MDNNKNDIYYIKKVIENIDIIITYTKGINYNDFVKNELLIDAIMFRLIQMVEQITHISQTFKEEHKNVAWGQILGFRNGIVHNYGKTDYSIVYEIISNDIYKLKDAMLEEIFIAN